jgi:hypothetical protein
MASLPEKMIVLHGNGTENIRKTLFVNSLIPSEVKAMPGYPRE